MNAGLALRISSLWSSAQNVDELIACLKSPEFRNVHGDFIAHKSQENVNFAFWWNYIEMVSTVLDFTRAQGEANWKFVFG